MTFIPKSSEEEENTTTMATETATSIKDKPTKPHHRKQNKQDELPKRHRSIFEVPSDFFDSCRLLQSLQISLPDNYNSTDGVVEESESEIEINEANNDGADSTNAKIMQRWSCNTCKVEFESLQDQRFHFKSDLHRFNIKLSISGRDIIREEDFDEAASDSLCKDYDVSSISGSDDEDEKENSLPLIENRQPEIGEISKSKIFMQLHTGERVAVWRCLLLDEYENISFENEKSLIVDGDGNRVHLTQKEVIEKLKYVSREPRDNTQLRIVLLARGGHFAGCVFDGNSLVAHKTFHRYVVRAKSGKKQSSKDGGGGRVIHSAGASLRRYNELGLKKDIQELLTLWKPHFALASCIFIYASSDNRQLFFDGKKPYFICQHRAVRNIPLTVRRPTLKEARRIYSLLTQIYSEISGERAPNTKEELLSGAGASAGSYSNPESCEKNLREDHLDIKVKEVSSLGREMDELSVTVESEREVDVVCTTTPLHEASKSGNLEKVLELLEQGLDPCIKDERGQTPYMLASEKEVRNTFRRFMAANLEKWDWNAAKVPSALTKEMEDSQAAKQAEKDAKRKAKAKELKKQRKAKEKKAQAEAAQSQAEAASSRGNSSLPAQKGHSQPSGSAKISKEEELRRSQAAEREKRAAAAERRMAAAQKTQGAGSLAAAGSDNLCSCCNDSLAGKVPFHRYNYKYCSSTCMHLHKEILEVE